MKRSSRIILLLAVAATTFGSLTTFVGTDHWHRYPHHHDFFHEDCEDPIDDPSN